MNVYKLAQGALMLFLFGFIAAGWVEDEKVRDKLLGLMVLVFCLIAIVRCSVGK